MWIFKSGISKLLEDIEMILDKLENTEKELEEVVDVKKIDSSYQDVRDK